MDNAKVKNYIILVLLLVNVFLLGIVLTNALQERRATAERKQALSDVLSQNGIRLADGVELTQSVPAQVTLRRDDRPEWFGRVPGSRDPDRPRCRADDRRRGGATDGDALVLGGAIGDGRQCRGVGRFDIGAGRGLGRAFRRTVELVDQHVARGSGNGGIG